MVQPISVVSPSAVAVAPIGSSGAGSASGTATSFAQTMDKALEQVSEAQETARSDSRGVITGAPGASLEQALIASSQAHLEWTAAVAVRNGVVNAYNTIINMQV